MYRYALYREFGKTAQATAPGTSPAARDLFKYPIFFKSAYDVIPRARVFSPSQIIYAEPLADMPGRAQHTFSILRVLQAHRGERARIHRLLAAMEPMPNATRLLTQDETIVSVFQKRPFPYAVLFAHRARRKKALRTALYHPTYYPNLLNSDFLSNVPFSVYNEIVGNLMDEIQRHMLEPTIDGGLSWQLWSVQEVRNYLKERLSRFLIDTGIVMDRATFTTVTNQSTYDLNSTLADLRWVNVNGAGGSRSLPAVDQWVLDHGSPGWESQTGSPDRYLEGTDPLTLELVPTPSVGGEEGMYQYVKSTPFDLPSGTASADFDIADLRTYYLRIPAIFGWAIKYGVMADMLRKEGEANDPERASYCEERYNGGVALARSLVGTVEG